MTSQHRRSTELRTRGGLAKNCGVRNRSQSLWQSPLPLRRCCKRADRRNRARADPTAQTTTNAAAHAAIRRELGDRRRISYSLQAVADVIGEVGDELRATGLHDNAGRKPHVCGVNPQRWTGRALGIDLAWRCAEDATMTAHRHRRHPIELKIRLAESYLNGEGSLKGSPRPMTSVTTC